MLFFRRRSSEALKMLRVALLRRPNLSREKSLAFNLILRASHSTLAYYAIQTVPLLQSRHKKCHFQTMQRGIRVRVPSKYLNGLFKLVNFTDVFES